MRPLPPPFQSPRRSTAHKTRGQVYYNSRNVRCQYLYRNSTAVCVRRAAKSLFPPVQKRLTKRGEYVTIPSIIFRKDRRLSAP